MRKLWLLPMLLFLAACGATGTGLPTAPAAANNDVTAATAAGTAATAVTQEQPAAATPDAATQAAIVRDTDWTKGAAEPAVSIIEYGDFQ